LAVESLEVRVSRKDWSVVQQATGFSSEQQHALLPLLSHEEPEVRELVLNCLNAVGGSLARDGLTRALQDKDEIIRARACQFLHHHLATELLPTLSAELKDNLDEYVREHAALMIGKIGNPKAIPNLHEFLREERIDYTRQALTLALARLGDPRGQAEFLRKLEDPFPSRVAGALEDFVYVNDPRLVKHIFPLLADPRNAVNVGMSHSPMHVRVCDVAVSVLDRVLNHPFSFPGDPVRRFSDAEISEAQRLLFSRF
jgi:HEAT repeat protein